MSIALTSCDFRAAAIFFVTAALTCGCYTVEGPHPRDLDQSEVEWFPPDPTIDADSDESSEPIEK